MLSSFRTEPIYFGDKTTWNECGIIFAAVQSLNEEITKQERLKREMSARESQGDGKEGACIVAPMKRMMR